MSAVLSSIRVRPLASLTADRLADWQAAYERSGVRVQQSPAYAAAVAGKVVVADAPGLFAAFSAKAICAALGGDEPLLGGVEADDLAAVLDAVRRSTGKPAYAPLVDGRFAVLGGRDGFASWRRPPNSLVDWSDQGRGLWERVRARGTSQLDRKRRLIARDGLALDTTTTGEAAARDVLAVDDKSWKSAQGQGMRQRGQAELYGSLVRDGVLTVAFLRDGGKPVAFRLDGRTRGRLICLKWSYDEAYRRYSPGLHLLTDGLTQQWADRGLRVVDLFGGPDTLKDLLYTHRVPRVDVWCGDAERAAEQARDRRILDARVAEAHDAGKGLRHAHG